MGCDALFYVAGVFMLIRFYSGVDLIDLLLHYPMQNRTALLMGV